MALLQTTMVLAGAALLLAGGVRAWMWVRVRERRLAPPRIRSVGPDALPARLGPVYEAAEADLGPLGFALLGARRAESIDPSEGTRPERVYRHADTRTLAFVGPPLPGMAERPYRVAFGSRLEDGGVIATFDGLASLTAGFPPGWRCVDRDLNDLGRQWEAHLSALGRSGGADRTVDTPLDEWNRVERRALAETLREWEATSRTRRLSTAGPRPSWRFRPVAAWRLGCRLLAGERRVVAREADARRHRARQQLWRSSVDPVADATRPALDRARAAGLAWTYELRRAGRTRRDARAAAARGAIAAAAGTGALIGLGAVQGLRVAVVVAAVLALHELGHLAGRTLLSRWDVAPGGRARTGAGSRGARRAAVHALGPIPGLLLGLGALVAFARGGGMGWLVVGVASLTVNYFALLPLAPLDGGRVVEDLLLDRYPRAQVALLAGAVLAFTAAAWALHQIVLAGFAVGLAVALRSAWLAARALTETRRAIPARASRGERVRTVFETLIGPPFAGLPAARRRRIADRIVPRVTSRPTSRRAALAGAVAYVALLVGVPAAVAAGAWVLRGARAEGAAATGPRSATTAEAGQPGDQSSALRISEASVVGR